MPLGKNVRYRFKTLGRGKAVRLAYYHNKVIEATLYKKKKGILMKQKTLYKRYNAREREINKHL